MNSGFLSLSITTAIAISTLVLFLVISVSTLLELLHVQTKHRVLVHWVAQGDAWVSSDKGHRNRDLGSPHTHTVL